MMDANFFDQIRMVNYDPQKIDVHFPRRDEWLSDVVAGSCPIPSDLFSDMTLQDLTNWLVRLAKNAYSIGYQAGSEPERDAIDL